MSNDVGAGIITTAAGTGDPGYGGDGQPATLALLNEPKNLCIDPEGNLYIADSENHLIRRINKHDGTIHTVAGRATTQPQTTIPTQEPVQEMGDPVDPLAEVEDIPGQGYTQTPDLSGTVRYVVGQGIGRDRFAGDHGPATQALLNFPSAVAVDGAGAMYIADTLNHRVRRVDLQSGVIHTIAGTGQTKWTGDGGPGTEATLNEPVALAVFERKLYIADQSNNRVRMVNLDTQEIQTVAGTGESAYNGDGMIATETGLAGPSGLAVDAEGNLFIADTFNGRIRMVSHETGMISTVIGDGAEFRFEPGVNESSQSLSRPYGIALTSEGQVLITDSDNHLLRKWDPANKVMSIVAGTGQSTYCGDGKPALESALNFPFGVAVDPSGAIAVADTFNHRIRLIGV